MPGARIRSGLHYDSYVEPETGVLREAANYRKWRSIRRPRQNATPIEDIPLGSGREYRKIARIWYYQEFVLRTARVPQYIGGAVHHYREETVRTVVLKRQLGKKELKASGLKNG